MTMIRVARGLCSPLRDDVLTALQPFGVRVLKIQAWGEGHWHMDVSDDTIMPDADIWVRRHVCEVTVSDAQAKWAERLLWQTNKMALESRPLVPSLKWEAPADCKAGAHGRVGRGTMFRPWKDNDKPRAKGQRQTRRTRKQQRGGGILDTLAKWFR